jgi:Tol biopolymer transport system component
MNLNKIGAALMLVVLGSSCGGDSPNQPWPSYAVSACDWPVWYPSGNHVAYSHTPLKQIYYDAKSRTYQYVFCESLTGFWRVDSDGSNERMLLPVILEDPDWSADGRQLAFESGGNIWAAPTSGDSIDLSGAVQLTSSSDSFSPSWNPSGSAVSFSINANSNAGLYTVPITGDPARLIGSEWTEPDWSPDGSKFAFIGSVGGQFGIGVCDTNGANAHIIRSSGIRFRFPKWSPDGSQIAFTTKISNEGMVQLWVMSADGTDATQLTTSGTLDNFSWSPDGTEIAYVRFNLLNHEYTNGVVAVTNLATGAVRALTTNPSCGP